MRLTIEDHDKLANLYMESVLVEMDVGSVVGGSPTHGGAIENGDNYAKGDTRIPKVLGAIQTRKGKLKRKGKVRRKV